MPARNAPSAIDTLKISDEPTAIPSAITSTVKREQLARARVGDVVEQPRNHAGADDGGERHERRHLQRRDAERQPAACRRHAAVPAPKSAGSSTSARTVNRSSTTSQPTAMWPACVCRSLLSASTRISTTVLATARAMPKIRPADQLPAERTAQEASPSAVATALCATAPGTATPPDGEQLLEVELQADAEHQQDDADLGQLLGEGGVGHKAGRVRADERAGQQIADDRRQAEALRDVAEDQRRGQAAGERQDEVIRVHLVDCASKTS